MSTQEGYISKTSGTTWDWNKNLDYFDVVVKNMRQTAPSLSADIIDYLIKRCIRAEKQNNIMSDNLNRIIGQRDNLLSEFRDMFNQIDTHGLGDGMNIKEEDGGTYWLPDDYDKWKKTIADLGDY